MNNRKTKKIVILNELLFILIIEEISSKYDFQWDKYFKTKRKITHTNSSRYFKKVVFKESCKNTKKKFFSSLYKMTETFKLTFYF